MAIEVEKKSNTGGGVGGMGEEDSQLPIPNLRVAQLVYQLSKANSTDSAITSRKDLQDELLSLIKSDEMAPYYSYLLSLPFNPTIIPNDQSLLQSLQKQNESYLEDLDLLEEKAKQEEGDSEINDIKRKRATYLAKIGEKDKALQAHHQALLTAAGLGSKIDLTLTVIRIGMFHGDAGLTGRAIERCRTLISEGGDWDRRNRLKVYEGLHLLSIRNFSQASSLFLDALPTFTATELISYEEFVGLVVICGVRAEDRKGLKKRIIDSPEILQVIDSLPHLRQLSTSLYDSQYALFFKSLASVETTHLLPSRILGQHSRHYVKELRIIAYKQLLESYRSVTLENFAKAFGVSKEWIDGELAGFIGEGRLDARVDKVHGIIETRRPDAKNAQYSRIIKEGDVLLNSLQKLSRTAL